MPSSVLLADLDELGSGTSSIESAEPIEYFSPECVTTGCLSKSSTVSWPQLPSLTLKSNPSSSTVSSEGLLGGFDAFRLLSYKTVDTVDHLSGSNPRIMNLRLTATYMAEERIITVPRIESGGGVVWKNIRSKTRANITCT